MKIIIFILIGLLIGFFIFPKKYLKINNIISQISVCLLLFSMGVTLGGGKNFINDIKSSGTIAFLFALFGILFSVLLVYLVVKFLLKKEIEDDNISTD